LRGAAAGGDADSKTLIRRIERALEAAVPVARKEEPAPLFRALRYAVFPGGKRLRPLLCLLSNRAVGGTVTEALPAAVALELIHCYSLVHDDLPAMDDDALRRGRPSCHVAFGEALAILAGDALLTLAFEHVAAESPPHCAAPLVEEIAKAAGVAGMVGGQAADVLAVKKGARSEARVNWIHEHKTAALIRAAVRCGVLAARSKEKYLEPADRFGRHLGIVFQIVDDLIGRSGDPRVAGKPVGRDERRGKLTYPSVVGEARARRRVEQGTERAVSSARQLPHPAELERLALQMKERVS